MRSRSRHVRTECNFRAKYHKKTGDGNSNNRTKLWFELGRFLRFVSCMGSRVFPTLETIDTVLGREPRGYRHHTH